MSGPVVAPSTASTASLSETKTSQMPWPTSWCQVPSSNRASVSYEDKYAVGDSRRATSRTSRRRCHSDRERNRMDTTSSEDARPSRQPDGYGRVRADPAWCRDRPGYARPMRYAYLGPEGTFAEAALRTIPEVADGSTLPQRSVYAAIEAVRCGTADAAVVPLENSVEGSVASTLDELATGAPLRIVREVLLPVTFSLLVRPGTDAASVRTVATHPHAEAQTRGWLRDRLPDAEVNLTSSTAAAAVAVARGEYDAAVAAPIAGVRTRLTALAEDIADTPGAVTRFVLLARPGPLPPRTGADRTSLVAFIRDDRT